MSTPHNDAKHGDIAKICLMSGDPLRAKFVAENYFTNVVCFNTVRGMLGYTGEYKNKKISVMGHGMGMPSMGIYSYELYNFYDVECIIRFGSMGGIDKKLKLGDIVLAQGASTDSNYFNQFNISGNFSAICDFDLLNLSYKIALEKNISVCVGNVLSSDVFYQADVNNTLKWKQLGVLGVEMECAALYINSAFANKKSLGILTVSDLIENLSESLSAKERETKLNQMIELALNTAYNYSNN